MTKEEKGKEFQSSFELTGYITRVINIEEGEYSVSKLFRAYRLYNSDGYISGEDYFNSFKALSSLQVI